MRILHTSDWHLGRSFHGTGMLEAQRGFLDHLVRTVREEGVDVVLVAGDVYDRALPGVDVVALFDDALERLTATGAQVVISSGNHDSATRLGFGGRILARGGVHLRTRIEDIGSAVVLPLGADAELAVYGIPYLEPRLVAEALDADRPGHPEVTRAALDLVRADLARRRSRGRVVSVVMAHTFAAGGAGSDSERDLAVGGLGSVPLPLFDGFDYTALGHLHGRQTLSDTVRYSGSPLAYSFSEAGHTKGGWILDVTVDGVRDVRAVEWPAPRRLAVLRGTLDQLLELEDLHWAEAAYCSVTLTDAERPARAMERLRTRFPDTLVLGFEPEGGPGTDTRSYGQRISAAKDDAEICCGFLEHVRGRRASVEEAGLVRSTVDTARSLLHERQDHP
ncbi:exonuclease SbcD [Arthrobacter sp. RIT-PI-e]|uniref:metallophosphoesterase family protein n=1 Tax=Arthrobacter sp. RIT-PI-e TaxID=1681197 RepID=UPI000675DB62|nr:exonuclease SbcCD subunit D [Arthrobacter sp. RIT-PI-e]KNC20390.1 exonuclease SbcD [Arthrobacter sp. RIT-PI-e]